MVIRATRDERDRAVEAFAAGRADGGRRCTRCCKLIDAGLEPVPAGVTCLCDACEKRLRHSRQAIEEAADQAVRRGRLVHTHPVGMKAD